MTEEEAKTKWCPFARVASWTAQDSSGVPNNATAVNRTRKGSAEPMGGTRCIGSACMAWRETHMVTDANVDPRDGYCGLAGKP